MKNQQKISLCALICVVFAINSGHCNPSPKEQQHHHIQNPVPYHVQNPDLVFNIRRPESIGGFIKDLRGKSRYGYNPDLPSLGTTIEITQRLKKGTININSATGRLEGRGFFDRLAIKFGKGNNSIDVAWRSHIINRDPFPYLQHPEQSFNIRRPESIGGLIKDLNGQSRYGHNPALPSFGTTIEITQRLKKGTIRINSITGRLEGIGFSDRLAIKFGRGNSAHDVAWRKHIIDQQLLLHKSIHDESESMYESAHKE